MAPRAPLGLARDMATVLRGQVPQGVGPDPVPSTAAEAVRAGRRRADALDPNGAIDQLRAALELDPTHHGAATELALVLFDTGRKSDALATLEAFLRSNPRSAEARLTLVRCLLRTQDFEGAVAECRTCMQHRPNWDAPHQPLITALCRIQRAEEAKEVLQDLDRFSPDPRKRAALAQLIDRSA